MKTEATVKTWEKTRLQNLLRHKSGGYYVRLFLNGKEVWKSLKTKHFSVAESRLAEAQKEHRQRKSRDQSSSSAKMTFGQAAELHTQHLDEKVTIKPRTRDYWKEILAALLKSWPELASMEVRKITTKACRDWAARFARDCSPTRYNNTLALLRHVIDVAIENGVVFSNVATGLERKPVKPKILELPSLAQFSEFISVMRRAGGRDSVNCADFAEGLAFTGCRLSEAGRIERADLNFTTDEILIKGDPEDATKNGEIRRIPMIPNARTLLDRMLATRDSEPKSTPVFRVRECQKAMDRAAKKIGMARITHHDLRHFFATVCIESGVDIPTVSRWLGHKDGGALAMKTYGHLRREHSRAQAQKVSFSPAVAA
ncbi:site-specific integrase [Phragmitibacter flavus]|uniref:Site-specific integrase n=1 Tax=Phragmitibacter flavus TaxID=2576071 RepID=A0A5R8KHN7_9BACT|nr:site-specific integrase [Phragmitibacter flavus]TLD71495.1 site-specific integrase [Phragmitibacter flavus]